MAGSRLMGRSMRARKPRNLEGKIAANRDWLIEDPTSLKGSWVERIYPAARELHLDLGCGKGSFSTRSALADAHALYIGIDLEIICVANAAEKAHRAAVQNACFALGDAADLESFFAEGEVDVIHLNFSTPLPKRKHAELRLTHAGNLMRYRRILAPGGRLELRTDSQPFFDFTLTQLQVAGYEVEWLTRDLHADGTPAVQSEYEEVLGERGARICALRATLGEEPSEILQTAPMSLVEYLPDDLDSIEHMPYGMEDYIINTRNRRAREARRKGPAR